MNCIDICRAACCKNLRQFQLTDDEANILIKKGAILWETWDKGVYRLQGECPNLVDNRCSVHGTSKQPAICKSFPFLGPGCRDTRAICPDEVITYLPGEDGQQFNLTDELKFLIAAVRGEY